MVRLSPRLILVTWVRHTDLPVFTSTAIVSPSRVLRMIFPSANTTPRFTTSQQATPCAAALGAGLNVHFAGAPGLVRSSAYTKFGYDVTTYIVLFTTSGAASCPRFTPSEKVKATRSAPTFVALI